MSSTPDPKDSGQILKSDSTSIFHSTLNRPLIPVKGDFSSIEDMFNYIESLTDEDVNAWGE
jgi:hypothetical protein